MVKREDFQKGHQGANKYLRARIKELEEVLTEMVVMYCNPEDSNDAWKDAIYETAKERLH